MGTQTLRNLQRVIVVGLLAALAACNTVSGMGEDIQTGGGVIQDEAQDAQRSM